MVMVLGLFDCIFPVRKRDFKNERVGGDEVYGFREKRQVGLESGKELKSSLQCEDGHVFLSQKREGQ